jgi:PhnB protein
VSAPSGYTSVTPWIVSSDTGRLLAFARDAFGAEELARIASADGSISHAELRIGDAIVLAFDSRPGWPETPAFLRVYVEDADAAYRRALAAGAEPVTKPTDLFFGDRVARVRDPLGNVWWLQARLEDVAPDELARRVTDERYLEAMEYVQRSLDEALRTG